MKYIFTVLFFATFLLAQPSPSIAESGVQPYPDVESIPPPLVEHLRFGITFREQYIANVLQMIRQNAKDNKALVQQDIDDLKQRDIDQRRRQQFQQIVRYDLNLDGQVTADEVRRVYLDEREQRGQNVQGCEDDANRFIKTYDVDGDGVISLAEMSALRTGQREDNLQSAHIEALFALDPNHDGKLTAEELKDLAARAFATLDVDGNGILSQDELAALNARRGTEASINGYDGFRHRLETMKATCSGPPASPDETVVLLDISRGGALADYTVGGQDVSTTASRIDVASGAGKLYVVATASTPVIWQVQGDAARISHLLLVGPPSKAGRAMAGATGLEAGKMAFLEGRNCLPINSYDPVSAEWLQAKAAVKTITGKDAQAAVSAEQGNIFHVASDAVRHDPAKQQEKPAAPKNYDPDMWTRVLAAAPGGVANFNGLKIVSDIPAESYQVLPGEAGLARLIAEGKVKREVSESGERFWIVKDIPRYPADLSGARAVRFVLAKGVRLPAGELNHSCVVSGETGDYLAGNPSDCAR